MLPTLALLAAIGARTSRIEIGTGRQRARPERAGIVDEEIETPFGRVDQGRTVGRGRNVTGERLDLRAARSVA